MSIADKLVTIAENEQKVYQAGHAAGVQSEYDRFWDAFQDYGKRTNYTCAFAGEGWATTEMFRPKYDIVPITPTQMFARGSFKGDLVEHLDSLGIALDFSKCTSHTEVFYYTEVTHVGVIDTRNNRGLHYIFAYAYSPLKTVDLLILRDDGSQTFTNSTFIQCTGLTNITIQGSIGQSGINLQWSTLLSRASIESFINALSTTASGKSITLSKTAVDNAFETSTGAADGSTSDVWLTMMREEGYNHPDAVCIKPSGWAVNLA